MPTAADLLLLAVDPSSGTVRQPNRLGLALAAADLVDLAAVRRIEVAEGRIHVVEHLRTGDPVLDDTLHRLVGDPEQPELDSWIAVRAADRIAAHAAALLECGRLSGKLVSLRVDGPVRPVGLRLVDRRGREDLIEKLVFVARHEVDLQDDAFGALAHVAGLPENVVYGFAKLGTATRLRDLAEWFGHTWRYLPGCPDDLALGDEDLVIGEIHPAREATWRLAIRLVVQEAVKRSAVVIRKDNQQSAAL